MRTDFITKIYQDDLYIFAHRYSADNRLSFSTVKELFDAINSGANLLHFKNWYIDERGTNFPNFTRTQGKIGIGNLLNKKSIRELLKTFG